MSLLRTHPADRRVFILPDVHGHYGRLFDILAQEDLLDPLTHQRLQPEVLVVQLGDLGHFGESTKGGDRLCYQAVRDGWIDIVLLGNHDRAALEGHAFHGYSQADPDVVGMMHALKYDGRLQLALATHGHLITHAGLHARFADQPNMDQVDKTDPEQVADYINAQWRLEEGSTNGALWTAIGELRGGPEGAAGGILWRHWSEPMFNEFPQICGHSVGDSVRTRPLQEGAEDTRDPGRSLVGPFPMHICLDVGQVYNGRLTGLWLPGRRVVEVCRPDWGF